MSDLEDQFHAATKTIKDLPERPDNEALLKLYALYKQATNGDVEGKRPGLFDVAGGAKFDAWARLKGMEKEQAMKSYIEFVDELLRSS